MLPTDQSLTPQTQRSTDARLQAALAGEYSFSIKNIFDEAWEKTRGFKTLYWEAMGICFLMIIGLVLLGTALYVTSGIVFSDVPFNWDQISKIIEAKDPVPISMQVLPVVFEFAALFLFLPILAGILMMAIRRASGLPARVGTIFSYYQKPWRYFLADIWISIFFQYIPTFLTGPASKYLSGFIGSYANWLCIPLAITIGFYAYVSYFFAMPLLADRKLTTWGALETSRRVVGFHWFEVCRAVVIVLLVTILVPAIVIMLLASNIHPIFWTLIIIFVWLIPFSALSMAILYREVMGVFEKS